MSVRVRFAPSPTGPLHIGGVRTALFNFLFAKQQGGQFILRIEDTDQNRLVPGGEQYIKEALAWAGLHTDESPIQGGPYGPYRQSERLDLYAPYAHILLQKGWAYYAFDTSEALDTLRKTAETEGTAFQYDVNTRKNLDNSLSLSAEALQEKLDQKVPCVIRFKMPEAQTVSVQDLVRGEVTFKTDELDDKILLKSDGWPTYHLANVVDDHLMKITHVIRGEEWLPSVGLHVMLYTALDWLETMPKFGHLPLILRPDGKGKLSKRDGAKFGMPVYPLQWKGETAEESFEGFKEYGFEPEALINFLAFLGWNPGTEQEIFDMAALTTAFDLNNIQKGGARFDFEKAKWFNQQHLMQMEDAQLLPKVKALLLEKGHDVHPNTLQAFVSLFRERATILSEYYSKGYYCFEEIQNFDLVAASAKWKPERRLPFEALPQQLKALPTWAAFDLEAATKAWMAEHNFKAGEVLPILRVALCGSMQGPAVFDLMAFLGPNVVETRILAACTLLG